MTQQDILIKVIEKIDKLGISYMLTGAIATIFYGRPRTTHDIDIVIKASRRYINPLVHSFRDKFYISPEGIEDAIAHKTMFNVIHEDSGIKIDFWMLQDDDYDRERFGRRQKHTIFGEDFFLSSPEDVIIKKLLWFKDTDLDKHFDDALGVLQIQGSTLDFNYIGLWAKKLSILNLWKKLRKHAG